MSTITRILLVAIGLLGFAGCASNEKLAQEQADRKARLLTAYPVGLPRPEVHARLKAERHEVELKSALTGVRPANGWSATPPVPGNGWCARAELGTSKVVASFERYSMVDGLFSLCYYWFYYDDADALVDVDWQYQSD